MQVLARRKSREIQSKLKVGVPLPLGLALLLSECRAERQLEGYGGLEGVSNANSSMKPKGHFWLQRVSALGD